MTRRPDWPGRLAALLSAAEARPFDAQRWNCAAFALAAVEAVTGTRPVVRVRPGLDASADSAGFRPLSLAALDYALDGVTTVAEAMRIAADHLLDDVDDVAA